MLTKNREPDHAHLPRDELTDILHHLGTRVTGNINDALQLIECPTQRAMLMIGFVEGIVLLSTDVVVDCYEEDADKPVPRHEILRVILSRCKEFAENN
jgi:hypothetical protein